MANVKLRKHQKRQNAKNFPKHRGHEIMIETTLLIPVTADSNAGTFSQKLQNVNCRTLILVCHPQRPGVVWRGLRPCLFQSPKKTARRALRAIFQIIGFTLPTRGNDSSSNRKIPEKAIQGRFMVHRLRVQVPVGVQQNATDRIILWIQPPATTYFQYYFCGALIAWENRMILCQSLAAWCSTLGGGHFFCRHLHTAIALAQEQRRIALLMGDYNMAYKCTINEAYSYIYAGKFRDALKTIDSVAILNKRFDIHPLDFVIVNMCKSARLFCKRVRRASKKLKSSKTQQEALTFDDYQRIRVVEESSTTTTSNGVEF